SGMTHTIRWTLPKIEQRLKLIEPLVYRRHVLIPPFRYCALAGDEALQAVERDVDVSEWEVIEPLSHWGRAGTNYVLRSSFQVPSGWSRDEPVALYLPLGEPGDFSHPEALIYLDGQAYAASDRHHQEVSLAHEWQDGQEHTLAMTVWTGLGNDDLLALLARTVHPTREFASLV